MQGIKINDVISRESGNFLSFDLQDILTAIGDAVLPAKWLCHGVECTGESAAELHQIADAGEKISGIDLMRVLSGIHQIIDGEFAAYRGKATQPWLIVNAVDSSWFEVWSDDSEVLNSVRKCFREVSGLPPRAV